MTHSDQEIQENAFGKGIREVETRDRTEATRVRYEIREVLGGIQRAQLYNRQTGGVKHTPAERLGIEKVFKKHQVSQPWGI